MSKENLYDEKAIKKIKEIATDVDYAMMATLLTKQPLSVIPMSTKKVDDHGNIWFISGADSEHNANIKADSATQLFYSSGTDMKFLSIYGQSEIVTDNEIIKELYGKTDNTWLNGPEDPNTTAIKFTPSEAAYWDSDENAIVVLFKMAEAVLTGKSQDIGTTGQLSI